jgi:hypothetical protein
LSDRTVHGWTADGREVVRYERRGHWVIEGRGARQRVPVKHAARMAWAGRHYPGLPGGRALDAYVARFDAAWQALIARQLLDAARTAEPLVIPSTFGPDD